jgi:uncharacterized protein (TIGR02231 family)
MKKLLAMIIITAIGGMTFAASTEINESDSEITEVTVYGANAHITREATLNIPKGTNVFRLKDLSPYINEQSLQVLGTGDIIIHSFHYEVNYVSSIESDGKIQALLDKVKNLERNIISKNTRILVLNEQKDLMDKNKRLNEKGLTVAELVKLVEYFDEKLMSISNETMELQYDIKELENEKQIINNQLAEHNQKGKTPSGEIILKIEGGSNLTSTLEISYLTNQAGWSPAYDIKVKDVNSDINLIFKASLYNNTREDWKNVKLIFSNGNPNYSGVLPILNPWYLDLPRNIFNGRENKSRAQKSSMPAAVEMAMEAEEDYKEEPSIKPIQTAYVEQQTTVEYVVEKPYSLKSNNESVQVDLRSYEIPSTYKYYAIPKIDRSAYLVARIENWEQQGLLNGPANLYFQNRFVGKTFVDAYQFSDTFNISLGQDKSIVIKREMVDTFQKKNLIGSDRIDTRGYKITVRNTKSRPIDMVIYDQIPISANNEIIVKILESGDAKVDEGSGRLTWEMTLEAQSASVMEFGYEVKYPKDEYVVLN